MRNVSFNWNLRQSYFQERKLINISTDCYLTLKPFGRIKSGKSARFIKKNPYNAYKKYL